MSDTIEVRITANVSGAVQGMREAASATREAAEAIKSDLGGLGASAHGASEPMSGLSDVIKHYRQEMRTEGRYARFMAADIASMGLASKGAAGEVTQLVSAFAFGGGLGIGIELVKMTVKAFTELSEKEEKAREELKKYAEDSKEISKRLREEAELSIMAIEGAGKSALRNAKEIVPLQRERAELAEKIALAERNAQAIQEQSAADEFDVWRQQSEAGESQIQQMREQLKLIDERIKLKRDAIDPLNKAEASDDERKQAEQHSMKMLQIRAQQLEGEARLEADFRVKVAEIRKSEASLSQQDEEIEGERRVYARKLEVFRQAEAVKAAEMRQRQIATQTEMLALGLDAQEQEIKGKAQRNEISGAQELAALTQLEARKYQIHFDAIREQMKLDALPEKEKERLRLEELKLTAEHQKKLAEIQNEASAKTLSQWKADFNERASVLRSFGSTFGTVMAGMIGNTMSLVGAVREMAKTVTRTLIDLAIKWVEAEAVKTAASSASAVAGTPFVGPFLAVGALAAGESLVMGLLSQLPSAAGGWDVPTGINPITQLHSGEMVLPEKFGNVIRAMADGGGGGAGATIHIHAMDGASVRRVVEGADFQRALREAARNGWAR